MPIHTAHYFAFFCIYIPNTNRLIIWTGSEYRSVWMYTNHTNPFPVARVWFHAIANFNKNRKTVRFSKWIFIDKDIDISWIITQWPLPTSWWFCLVMLSKRNRRLAQMRLKTHYDRGQASFWSIRTFVWNPIILWTCRHCMKLELESTPRTHLDTHCDSNRLTNSK